jgi:hypothetical protein
MTHVLTHARPLPPPPPLHLRLFPKPLLSRSSPALPRLPAWVGPLDLKQDKGPKGEEREDSPAPAAEPGAEPGAGQGGGESGEGGDPDVKLVSDRGVSFLLAKCEFYFSLSVCTPTP